MIDTLCDIGIAGVDAAARRLIAHMVNRELSVAAYDSDPERVNALRLETEGQPVFPASGPAELAGVLRQPKTLLVLAPSRSTVDGAIQDVLPYLEAGDVLIDGSDSHFRDTDARGATLAGQGIGFLGVGISTGEINGRSMGSSLMAGGPAEVYTQVRPLLETLAAQVEGMPCAAWLGTGSAGHYVKMVQSGIEHGLMRLIAETYDFMKWGLALTDEELTHIYDNWNAGELDCFLLELTASIFGKVELETGEALVAALPDQAHQHGPGRWAVQEALELAVPMPTIAVAIAMRDLASLKNERVAASTVLAGPERSYHGNFNRMLTQLHNALYACYVLVFAQGLAELLAGSKIHDYGLKLDEVARVWQAGGTIRARILKKIRTAYHTRPDLPNILLDGQLGWEVMARQADLRAVVRAATGLGISVPAMAASLGYYDAYRGAWSPANLIQALHFGIGTFGVQ